MKKLICIICFLMLSNIISLAQEKYCIKGKVTFEDKIYFDPVLSVKLYDSTNSLIYSVQLDSLYVFSFNNLATGVYTLRLSSPKYITKTIYNIKTKDSLTINIDEYLYLNHDETKEIDSVEFSYLTREYIFFCFSPNTSNIITNLNKPFKKIIGIHSSESFFTEVKPWFHIGCLVYMYDINYYEIHPSNISPTTNSVFTKEAFLVGIWGLHYAQRFRFNRSLNDKTKFFIENSIGFNYPYIYRYYTTSFDNISYNKVSHKIDKQWFLSSSMYFGYSHFAIGLQYDNINLLQTIYSKSTYLPKFNFKIRLNIGINES